jgi:hypothetical protein
MGIDTSLFKSYFTNRKQYVSTNLNGIKQMSSCKEPILGIPQGSSLSGFLFDILINDLPDSLKYSEPVLYADDTQLMNNDTVINLSSLIQRIEEDLSLVSEWMNTNKLKINPDKIFFAVFCDNKCIEQTRNIVIKMNGCPIQQVDSIKILGLIHDHKLSWDKHVNSVVRKCNMLINDMTPLKKILSLKKKQILVNTCLLSVVNYCSVVYLKPNKANYKSILKVMKRAARFVTRKRYFDHISYDMYHKLKWLPPNLRYEYDVGCMAFKIMHGICPNYFKDYLCIDDFEKHETRSNVYYICNNIELSKLSFKHNATKGWLEMPSFVMEGNPNLKLFKRNLLSSITTNLLSDTQNNEIDCNNSDFELE